MAKEHFVIYRLNYSPGQGLTFTERYFKAEYKPPTELLPARYSAKAFKPFARDKSIRYVQTLTTAELLEIEDVPLVRRSNDTFRVALIRRQSPNGAPPP